MPNSSVKFVNYLKPLGQGGFAIAYLVVNDAGRNLVAKQFSPNPEKLGMLIDSQVLDDLRESFGREGARHELLIHRNLVRSLGQQLLDGYPTLLVEYLPYCLDRWLGPSGAPKALSLHEAFDIVEQLAIVIDYLQTGYQEGVLAHKDVKADNIFIDWDNTVKLGDLGIATLLHQYGETGVRVAFTNLVGPVGSPEGQIATAASDSWALGLLFLHILSGQCPSTAAVANWMQNPEGVQQWIQQHNIPLDALTFVNSLLADEPRRLRPLQIRCLLDSISNQDTPVGQIIRAIRLARACMERASLHLEDAEASGEHDYVSRIGAYRDAGVQVERAIQHRSTEHEPCRSIPYWVRLAQIKNRVGELQLAQGNHALAEEEFRYAVDISRKLKTIGWDEPWMAQQAAVASRNLAQIVQNDQDRLQLFQNAVLAQWRVAQICPSFSEIRLLHDDYASFEDLLERSLSNHPRTVADDVRETHQRLAKSVGKMMFSSLDSLLIRRAITVQGQVFTDYEVSALDIAGRSIRDLCGLIEFAVVDERGNTVRDTDLDPRTYYFKPADHGKMWLRGGTKLKPGWKILGKRKAPFRIKLSAQGCETNDFVFEAGRGDHQLTATLYDEAGKWLFDFRGDVRLLAVDAEMTPATTVHLDPSIVSLRETDMGRFDLRISVHGLSLDLQLIAERVDAGQSSATGDFTIASIGDVGTQDDFTLLRVW